MNKGLPGDYVNSGQCRQSKDIFLGQIQAAGPPETFRTVNVTSCDRYH